MECYQVGGAVRDRLLGKPVVEKDYVVVGSSPEALLSEGFKQVGKDFPVFLHPITHEEYALARTERKKGSGYKGFTVYAAPEVTLKEDLKRRDLTINAIAQNEQGELIDPYGGCEDLKKRILRHVSPAFIEDPVRVLRIARFMARFAYLGFRIAPETTSLMKQVVFQGEIESLVPERVWKEFQKALNEPTPTAFINSLLECGAWERLCPAWIELSQSQKTNALQTLEQATQLSQVTEVRFASFIKGIASQKETSAIERLSAKWRLPTSYRELAVLSARYVDMAHRVTELTVESLLDLFMQLDILRRETRFQHFLVVCQADWIVSHKNSKVPYRQKDYMKQAVQIIKSLDLSSLIAQGVKGSEFQVHLRQLRIEALTQWRTLHHK